MARKCADVIIYGTLLTCSALMLYFVIYLPSFLLFPDKKPDAKDNLRATGLKSPIVNAEERAAYNQLISYILNPKHFCKSSVLLGGKKTKVRSLDGDKLICLDPGRPLKKGCIVYSFGIANDWSFDEVIQRKFNCKVFAFDPSMNLFDHLHSQGIWFYNTGIAEFDGDLFIGHQHWKMKTFDSILKQLGHTNKSVDVLKIDIEGAEYVVLEDMLNKGLLKNVNHLCVEMHLSEMPYWERVHKLLKRLEDESGLLHFSTRNNTVMPPTKVPGNYARYEQHFFEMAWFRP